MSHAVITLIILAVAAILFISEKLPVPLTAMLSLAALVLTGVITPSAAIEGFSNSTIILLTSMLLVGGALFETGITAKIAKNTLKFAKTERQMIMIVFLLGTVLSALLNNTAVMAMMIPLLLGIESSVGYSASKMMMAGFLGVMCGGRLTLIGDVTVNSIAQSGIKAVGGTFGAFDIGKIGLPLTIVTFLWLFFYGYKHLPERKSEEANNVYADSMNKTAPVWQQIVSIAIIVLVFLGMCLEGKIGIPLYMIAMLGAIALCTTRILKGKQVYNMMDMSTIFLYAGMIPLGTALQKTGAAQMIATGVSRIIGSSGNVYLITAIVFIVACFMTQFTSNVVTITLLIPIVVAIGKTLGVSPAALIVTATIASTHGYVSPISCPPATIIYGNGGFKFRDYAKCNWSLLLISFLICIFLLPALWPVK